MLHAECADEVLKLLGVKRSTRVSRLSGLVGPRLRVDTTIGEE